MIILSATSLTLQFGTDTVLENISFSVEEGDRIGVIGVNGCGISSLFRMLCHGVGLPGGTEPTAGEVYLAKGRTVGILTQEGAFAEDGEDGNGDQSALEHMYHAFPELLAAETRLDEMQKAQLCAFCISSMRCIMAASRSMVFCSFFVSIFVTSSHFLALLCV